MLKPDKNGVLDWTKARLSKTVTVCSKCGKRGQYRIDVWKAKSARPPSEYFPHGQSARPEVIYDEWYHKAHVMNVPGLGVVGLSIDERCSVKR